MTTTVTQLDELTEYYKGLYQQMSGDGVFTNSNNTGQPIILSSLHQLDNLLKANTTKLTRMEGSNVDTVETDDGRIFFRCHLATLLDFSHDANIPYKHAFEAAAAISLAAHHLNEGIAWVVPELADLPDRCPIRFTTEFADTEYDQGVSLKHVIDMTDRPENKPCAFIGATRNSVSVPTAIVTGIRGYPQISSQSTSEQLDDVNQFPLFGRTVPSDVDNAVPIVKFFRERLDATHLAVLHVNNGYGNAFADDLKFAAQKHAPDLKIEEFEISEHPNEAIIREVVQNIKKTEFRYIFAALNDKIIDSIVEMAYHEGVAGNGIHNWYFSNSFGDIDDRLFELDSPLRKVYRGAGRMEVSGGHPGMASFDTFACNLRTLRSSPPDLNYFASLLPQKEWRNTYYNDILERDFSKAPYVFDEDFMDPVPKMADRTSPAYEAAIALGLAACKVAENELPLSGQNVFDEFKRITFKGVEANLAFLNETGTRDPNTTLFAVENEVEELVEIDRNGTMVTMAKFHAEVSDIYDHGAWEHLKDYIFNDGTTDIPADLTPPFGVKHNHIHLPLKIVAIILFFIVFGIAVKLWVWTERNKEHRVIRASQPLFLRVILFGVIVFASAIIPLNIDDQVTSIYGCTIACNFYYWLFFMGFSIMFCGLFTKIYRVNQIMNNPIKFKRIKVTAKDVIKPMVAIIGMNFLLLTIMTAVAPSHWEISVTRVDQHGRAIETFGHCTTDEEVPFYISLGVLNISLLCVSLKQAYDTRKLSTEFSESRYIFYAMIGIMVALFQGIPVLILVQDSPDVQDFIKCTVIFVTCFSVMLFLFIPKVKFLRKHLRKTPTENFEDSVRVSGLDPPFQQPVVGNAYDPLKRVTALSALSGASSTSNGSGSGEGAIFTTMSSAAISEENRQLRQILMQRKVPLLHLASDGSVSNSSSGSDGINIVARKSPAKLLEENRGLKKLLKQNPQGPNLSHQSIAEEKEGEIDDDCAEEVKRQRKVSFQSTESLLPLVMPTESEAVSVEDVEAPNDEQRLSSDDSTAPNSSDTTPPASADVIDDSQWAESEAVLVEDVEAPNDGQRLSSDDTESSGELLPRTSQSATSSGNDNRDSDTERGTSVQSSEESTLRGASISQTGKVVKFS